MAHTPGPLPPTLQTQMECPVPGFDLVELQLLQAFEQ